MDSPSLPRIEALLNRKRQLEMWTAFNNDALKWLGEAVELLLTEKADAIRTHSDLRSRDTTARLQRGNRKTV